MNRRFSHFVPTALAAAVLLALSATATAQDTGAATQQDDTAGNAQTDTQSRRPGTPTTLSTVIVTGTRAGNRSEGDSLTPVDVIPAAVLTQTGAPNLGEALQRAVPSMNFPLAPASDTFAFQRPFELRGLSPDEVLVLVNGKRWHSGALLLSLGQVGQGSQAVDLNTIPLSAIDHIEVLRDGASAQYGSDAIAGVVNIILKKGAHGGDVQLVSGKYSAGDGQMWQAHGDVGMGGDKGWVRLAVDLHHQDPTNRAGVDRRVPWLGQKFHFGQVLFRNQNLMLNSEYDFSPNVQFYAFGHYGRRVGEPRGFFRYGTNTPFPNNPLIGEVYPDGFLPREHGDSIDRSLVAGLRGNVNYWHWDVSANHGDNKVYYSTLDTVNYALLNDFGSSPLGFHDGTLRSSQDTFDIDISRGIADNWTLSFGTQWLHQAYKVEAGDFGSWYVGTSGVRGGAQGFAGWGPQDEISVSRHAFSEYVQLEGNITEKLSTSLAARHEHYSDFGSTTSFAISGRYDFSPQFAIRGSASSGFRAPSLGQQHYSETTSAAQGPGNSLGLPPGIYLRGLVPVSNPIAMLLGAEPLEPETSRNYTAGFVWRPSPAFDTTVDIYQIMLHNRIALSSQISLALPSVIDYLAANGITNLQYSGISYFTNAGNVKTRGIDVVSTYRHTFDNGGSLLTTLGATYHKNKVSGVRPNPEVLDALGAIFQRLNRSAILGLLADTMPRSKIILTSTYNLGNWGVTGTATRYGKFTSFGATSPVDDVTYPGKWIFDLAVNYYRDNWTFTLGSDNVFNTYPKRVPEDDDNNGVFPYSSSSPFGFEGSFIYAKMGYRW